MSAATTECARPAVARCGGATPTAISPRPAATDPQPEGAALRSGSLDVFSLNCAGQASQPARRLSGEGKRPDLQAREAAIKDLIEQGHTKRQAAAALGLTFWQVDEAMRRARVNVPADVLAQRRRENNSSFIAAGQARRAQVLALAATCDTAAIAIRVRLSRSRVQEILHEAGVSAANAPAKRPSTARPGRTREEQRAEYAARQEALARELRALVEGGMPVRTAGRQLGITKTMAERVARQNGIKPDPLTLKNWRAARTGERNAARAAANRAAKRPADPIPPPAPANPYRTAAQQQQVDRIKAQTWRRRDARLQALGAPTQAEADALVAQFLARRSVTVCPPAAEVAVPTNGGIGWR